MAQQTAVEWLEIQFDKYTSGGVNVPNNKIFKLTEKAKAMEKEQIINAACYEPFLGDFPRKEGEHYYNKTYNK
jgi:hypothetical protein